MRVLYTDEACLEVVGEAKRFLAGVILRRQAAGVVQLRDKLVYGDFTFIATASAVAEDKVIIVGESGIGGFLCHPQTTDYPGGKSSADDTPLPHVSDYPLLDDDLGTFHVYTDGSEWLADREGENYGNIDWKGMRTTEEGEASDAPILTWKGPPSRHFPLDPKQSLPGLTVLDEEVEEGGLPITYYTPFGPNVYEGGEVLATFTPMGVTTPKVLGACYRDGILTVMVGTNYRGGENPTGGVGGFFYELWQQRGEWTRLGYRVSSRQTVPWFFSASGNKAACVQDGLVYRCVISSEEEKVVAVFSVVPSCQGEQNIEKYFHAESWPVVLPALVWEDVDTSVHGSQWTGFATSRVTFTVTRELKCVEAIDFTGEDEVVGESHLTGSIITKLESGSSESYKALDKIPQNAPAALTAGVSGLSATGAGVANTTRVTASGGCGPYTYSSSGATVDATGLVTSFSACGSPGAPALVTFTVTDSRGSTATAQIKHPSGHYQITQTFDAGCYCAASCGCDSTTHCGCQHTGSGYHVGGSGNWVGTGDYTILGGASGCRAAFNDYTACGSLIGDGTDPMADICSGCKLSGITLYSWVC